MAWSMGERRVCPASEVKAGEWTVFSGYRRVMSVAEGWVTEGRGKKRRTYLSKITLERVDGTVDRLDPDTELTIYAPDVA